MTRVAGFAAALAAVFFMTLGDTQAAPRRAAGIEYEFVARPGSLPEAFKAPAGVELKFLAIQAIDGFTVNAALWHPEGKAPASTTMVITVHGSGGSYTGPPNGFLSPLLALKNYGVLAINTRQTGAAVNTDNFLDVRRDIEAAVYTARALGYKTLVLHGHSLGNIQVQYYAANNWDADIKAVVLSGMFANLPWKSRNLLVQNEENYKQLADAAKASLQKGTQAEVMPVKMGWVGGEPVPITAQHFLTYRQENVSTADGTYWIRRIPRPILMLRDEGDAIVQPFEPYMLLSAATAEGSVVPEIKYIMLPDPKGRSAAAHGFIYNQQPLADTIAAWLAERKL
jgi:pimeloyl-ACP methyl ester carboxylesterase